MEQDIQQHELKWPVCCGSSYGWCFPSECVIGTTFQKVDEEGAEARVVLPELQGFRIGERGAVLVYLNPDAGVLLICTGTPHLSAIVDIIQDRQNKKLRLAGCV